MYGVSKESTELQRSTAITHSRQVCSSAQRLSVRRTLRLSLEAVNGGSRNPLFSGIPFWEHQLDLGYRLTAIGGSDSHRPMIPLDQPGSIDWPTTVVYASDLSTPAILEGIRSGRLFIDLTGSRDRILEMQAQVGSAFAVMGANLDPRSGETLTVDVHVVAGQGASVHFLVDGKEPPAQPPQSLSAADQTIHFTWQTNGVRHWMLAKVRDGSGELLLLGNPIYINWSGRVGRP